MVEAQWSMFLGIDSIDFDINNPEWWSALGTVGALIAAVVAAVAAVLLYGRERSRDAQREQERRSQQAETVAAWIGEVEGPGVDVNGGRHTVTYWAAHVSNASNVPVYDLLALALHPRGMSASVHLHVLAPNSVESVPFLGLLKATPINFAGNPRFRDGATPSGVKLVLSFADAGGRLWTRDEDGMLSPSLTSQRRIVRAMLNGLMNHPAPSFYGVALVLATISTAMK